MHPDDSEAYVIALSVMAAVRAPVDHRDQTRPRSDNADPHADAGPGESV